VLSREVAGTLKKWNFKVSEIYNYHLKDPRIKKGYTIINRIELNGQANFDLWLRKVRFLSPKHLEKIRKWKEK